ILEEPIVIASAVRTPIGRLGGTLRGFGAVELGSVVIKEAVKRAGIPPGAVKEAVLGNAVAAGTGQGAAKRACLLAGLDARVAARTVNSVCGSGLASVAECTNSIALGISDVCVAGGMESASNSPYIVFPWRRDGDRVACKLAGSRPVFTEPDLEHRIRTGEIQVRDATRYDGLCWPMEARFMGEYAREFAARMGYALDDINAAAEESYCRAEKATQLGLFSREIVPVGGACSDEIPNKEAREKLLARYPCDPASSYNSSRPSDGAAAVVLMSQGAARRFGVSPLAHIRAYSFLGCAPADFLVAPVEAAREIQEFVDRCSVVEANEAFAMQLLLFREAFSGMDVNPHGGAVAFGHPLGASGTRILVTLLHEMERRQDDYGLATVCFGGGGAYAVVVSRCT
ncbi:MAG: thiolase family protein, partial [Bacillota bacterium]